MSSDAAKKTMESNRICFIKVIECLHYLARQGQAMQGDTNDESNFIQLLKLRGKDQPLLLKWLQRKEDRCTSHDIQNEIIAIMANHVIRDLVSEIRGGFFSSTCDEYTDISYKEQLTICIRWVDKELQAHEDFFGFYNVSDNGAKTMVSAIKDVLLKLQFCGGYQPVSHRRADGRDTKQLLDEVEHDIMNYQNQGLCYLPKPKADNS